MKTPNLKRSVAGFAGAQTISKKDFWEIPADILIPAALGGEITSEIAEEWGRINVPDSVAVADGLMAATARVHGLTLVTRNTAHLARTGVRLFDPFEG